MQLIGVLGKSVWSGPEAMSPMEGHGVEFMHVNNKFVAISLQWLLSSPIYIS